MVLFFLDEKFGDFGSQVTPFVMDLSLEKFEEDYKDFIGREGFVFGLKLRDDFGKFLKDLLQQKISFLLCFKVLILQAVSNDFLNNRAVEFQQLDNIFELFGPDPTQLYIRHFQYFPNLNVQQSNISLISMAELLMMVEVFFFQFP
jgi:hypothetical protein